MSSQSESYITDEEKERKKQELRKKGQKLAIAFNLDFRNKQQRIRDYAEEWKGLVKDEYICVEVIKALVKAIQEKSISVSTIREALPNEYKQDTNIFRGRHKKRDESEKEIDPLNLAIEFIEKVSNMSYSQIRKMPREQFLEKYRQFFVHDLKGWIDHDVHQMALILNYLFPLVRDMVERIEEERATLRHKDQSGIGGV